MIDPVAFSVGPLEVKWYGLAYGAGFLFSLLGLIRLNRDRRVFKTTDQIYDMAFWVFLFGIVLGGRLGYVLFYNLPWFLQHPLEIFAVWNGGMSFHGGLIGSFIAAYLWSKKHRISLLDMSDIALVPASFALAFGRLANFVNRELPGRPLENPDWRWLGVDLGDGILRWPSQLFAAGKDVLIFLILWLIFRRNPRRGILTASFLMLYGFLRFLVEFFRLPDPQVGYILGVLTLGQIFSAAAFALGFIIYIKLKKRSS